MKIPESVVGFLEYNNQTYSFSFDKDNYILSLYPQKATYTSGFYWKSLHTSFTDVPSKIKGIDSTGAEVIFYLSNPPSFFNCFIQIPIKTFYYGKPMEDNISGLAFSGHAINLFRPPYISSEIYLQEQKVEKISVNYQRKEQVSCGSCRFEELEVELFLKENVTYIEKSFTNPIATSTVLILELTGCVTIEKILEIIHSVNCMFQYVAGRKNICLDQVELLNSDRDVLGILSHNCSFAREDDNDSPPQMLTYQILGEQTAQLLKRIHSGAIECDYLLNSSQEKNTYTVPRCIFLITKFERYFRYIYGEGSSRSAEFNELKSEGIELLTEWKTSKKGKDKKIAKELLRSFSVIDDSYARRLFHALEDCQTIMNPFIKRYYPYEEVRLDDIAQTLSQYRNALAHGSDVDSDVVNRLNCICILDKLLYVMQLKDLGLDNSTVQKGINQLFCCNFAI